MKQTSAQICLPLYLCVLCQVLYASCSVDVISCTAREMLYGGLCAALATAFLLCGLLALRHLFVVRTQAWVCKRMIALFACLLFAGGMVQTVLQQLRFYLLQFGAGYLWVLLFAVLACLLSCTPHALVRCAAILLVLSGVLGVVCVAGLLAQSSFAHLSVAPLSEVGVRAAFWAGFLWCPEYFALLFSARAKPRPTKQILLLEYLPFFALPFFGVAVQVALLLCSELVFGVAPAGGFEILRSWAFLTLSRLDGVVVLLWLLLAFFRLRFLSFLLVQVFPCTAEKREVGGYGAR